MAAKLIKRPQARVFGILDEGAYVRRSTSFKRADLQLQSRPSFTITTSNHMDGLDSRRPMRMGKTKLGIKPEIFGSSPIADQLGAKELQEASSIIANDEPPSEESVRGALQICETLARSLAEPIESTKPSLDAVKGPTSNLLLMEEEIGRKAFSHPQIPQAKPIRQNIANSVSVTAFNIISDSKVFITPDILAIYVSTQSILGRPKSFPLVFDLYGSKPTPQSGTRPIRYEKPNPKRASSAVPLVLTQMALDAAIKANDLPLCLSIIETSVCSTAYIRNKILRKAFLPFSGLALAPAAAYIFASNLAQYQYSMDTQMATNMAFVGIMAYVTFTSIIGVVAITTSNDQMDRIIWAMGTPLRERWLREDERALVDQVAGAWGFQDMNMRGEEEGPEWEALREWAGQRGLILDKPELMEGME